MSRAEMRRQKKAEEKKQKVYTITAKEYEKIRIAEYERARAELLARNEELTEELFLMMLAIPTNVLVADYWEKTAKKRIPEFVEKCISLYQSWSTHDVVKMQEMVQLTEEYSGMKLVDERSVTGRVINSKKYGGV